MSDEVTGKITLTNPDGTPFTPTSVTSHAYAEALNIASVAGAWWGTMPPPQPVSPVTIYATLSDADVERIADAVVKRLKEGN